MEVLCLRSSTTSRSSKTALEASSGVGSHTTIIDERLEFYSLFNAFFLVCLCSVLLPNILLLSIVQVYVRMVK
jgi:hypothetical protein